MYDGYRSTAQRTPCMLPVDIPQDRSAEDASIVARDNIVTSEKARRRAVIRQGMDVGWDAWPCHAQGKRKAFDHYSQGEDVFQSPIGPQL